MSNEKKNDKNIFFKCCACIWFSLFHSGTGRGRDGLKKKIVGGKVRGEIMTFKLVVRFESSEVQYLSFNSLLVANSKKHSLGNHGGGRTCAKKS